MYNQRNLGDCFLLRFADSDSQSFLLIDFGSYEGVNKDREKEIAASIRDTVQGHPLKIVLTHQHKDHLTGFVTAASEMDELNISELWMSYLDDPNGSKAIAVREMMNKYWNKNKELTKGIKKKFGRRSPVKNMLKAKEGYDLFAEHQRGGEAITNLLGWCNNNRRFLYPGDHFAMPDIPGGAVRVYALGPPLDTDMLKKMNPGKNDAVNGLNATSQLMNIGTSTDLLLSALDLPGATGAGHSKPDSDFPFAKRFVHKASEKTIPTALQRSAYFRRDNAWRKIDHEWLSEAGRVALYMDTLTNNSSLVLAFELVEQQKVLLFVGDAQIGNWKSWLDVKFKGCRKTAEELLSKTVLYKAGHHSSHNATLLESLNRMNTEDLVIMIPVNKRVSDSRGFAMLRPEMLMGYNRKSKGRVLRSDTVFHKTRATSSYQYPFKDSVKDFDPPLRIKWDSGKKTPFYIEYDVK